MLYISINPGCHLWTFSLTVSSFKHDYDLRLRVSTENKRCFETDEHIGKGRSCSYEFEEAEFRLSTDREQHVVIK